MATLDQCFTCSADNSFIGAAANKFLAFNIKVVEPLHGRNRATMMADFTSVLSSES